MQLDGPPNINANAFRPPPPPCEGLDHVTARWLQLSSMDENWMPARQALIEYLTAVQRAQYGAIVTAAVKTDTFIKMVADINEIKESMTQRPATGPKSFKDALVRAPPPPLKAPTPHYKHNEVVVKLNDPDAIHSARNTSEARLVEIVNGSLKKDNIDVNIRSVNKLPSGDLAVQTRCTEDSNTLKQNETWTKILSAKANTVTKTYPVLVYTHKLNLLKKLGVSGLSANIKQWNSNLMPLWITPLQPGKLKEKDVNAGGIIVVFRTKSEANEAIDYGVVLDGNIHRACVYDRECRIKQCFNCYKYGHFSSQCTNTQVCGRCGHGHATPLRGKPQHQCRDEYPDKCTGCHKQHPAWSKSCRLRMAEIERIKQARANVPLRYEGAKTPTKISDENTENHNDNDDEYQTVPPRGQKRKTAPSKGSSNTTKRHAEKERILAPVLNDAVRTRRQSKAVTVCEDDENTMNTSAG